VGASILVVEDDRDLRECLVDVLRAELPDLEVRDAADGRQALAAIEQRAPALVLLDMFMPVMNGEELLGELDRVHPGHGPRVIILSAGDDERRGEQPARVVGTLRKPVHVDQLLEAVQRWSAA
jgi:CheY-like chemotaxis protein